MNRLTTLALLLPLLAGCGAQKGRSPEIAAVRTFIHENWDSTIQYSPRDTATLIGLPHRSLIGAASTDRASGDRVPSRRPEARCQMPGAGGRVPESRVGDQSRDQDGRFGYASRRCLSNRER